METRLGSEETPENERPVNQLSKRALKKVNEMHDPGALYFVQLVDWALASGELRILNPSLYSPREKLRALDPAKAQDWLEKCTDNPDEEDFLVDEHQEYESADLAFIILDRLDSYFSAIISDYPKPLMRD